MTECVKMDGDFLTNQSQGLSACAREPTANTTESQNMPALVRHSSLVSVARISTEAVKGLVFSIGDK